ncbi:MAG: hypothetical protein ACRD2T_12465 [Thermoanaerobaculia bacterium]
MRPAPAAAVRSRPGLLLLDVQMPARGGSLERIVVRAGDRIHVLPLERIDLIEARDDAVRIRAGYGRLKALL